MKKMWMPVMFVSLMLILLAASPVFGASNMGGAEPPSRENPGPPIYYVVQFQGPIVEEWKDQITQKGGELLGYIPHFAFKVRMNPAQAKEVEKLESVGGVLPFLPEYKLSPRLADEGTNLYRVKVERGADAGLVAAAIAKSDAQILARQGNILVISADADQLQPIVEILDVAWVENFQFNQKYNDGAGVIMGANLANNSGYDGSTQIVAVADSGLGDGTVDGAHPDIPAERINNIFSRTAPDVPGCYDVVDDGAVDEASGHGTHVTVSVLGDGGPIGEGKGTAPAASLIFQAIEDWIQMKGTCAFLYTSGYYLVGIPFDLRDLYQQAYNAGARTHSNSWGSLGFGEYTIDSGNTDDFIWNNPDASILFAAGNDGLDLYPPYGEIDTCDPQNFSLLLNCLLSSPATAKNVITVGASENARPSYPCDTSSPVPDFAVCQVQGGENQIFPYYEIGPYYADPIATDLSAGNAEQMAAFSSRGPAFDGRIKPDVVAPGTWVLSGYSDLYQEGYDSTPNRQNGEYQYPGWGFPYN